VTGRVYLDTSAAVKLVVTETESQPLERFLAGQRSRLSSRVMVVELVRAVARRSPGSMDQARSVLQLLEFVELSRDLAERAGDLEPAGLRSLDAIHLASALAVGDELDAFVTYDARQAGAARSLGLTVESPI